MKSKLFETYRKLAEEVGLAYPEGRALYMLSRHWNGGLGRYGLGFSYPGYWPKKLPRSRRARQIAALQSIKDTTAERWAVHYYNDGSPKGIKYTNKRWNEYKSTTRYDTKQNGNK